MVKKLATTFVLLEAVVIVLLITLLLTPKEGIIKLSNVLNFGYRVVLVER